jgi:hypothetical protein
LQAQHDGHRQQQDGNVGQQAKHRNGHVQRQDVDSAAGGNAGAPRVCDRRALHECGLNRSFREKMSWKLRI